MGIEDITRQASEASAQAMQQGETAKADIRSEAESQRKTIRANISTAERTLQTELQAERNRQALYRRRRAAGIATDRPESAPDNTPAYRDYQAKLQAARAAVDTSEATGLADIDKQVSDIKKDIETQKNKAIEAYRAYEVEKARIEAINAMIIRQAIEAQRQEVTYVPVLQATAAQPKVPTINDTQAPSGVPQDYWDNSTPEGRQAWLNYSVAQQNFSQDLAAGQIPSNSVFSTYEIKPDGLYYEYTLPSEPVMEPVTVADIKENTEVQKKVSTWLDTVNDIWQSLTPWAEDKGETVLSYLKNLPSTIVENMERSTKPNYGYSQAELKQMYEATENAQWWEKALGLVPTNVMKEPDGTYTFLYIAVAPDISKGSVSKVAKVLTTTIDIVKELGWDTEKATRFLRARVTTPSLTPEQFEAFDRIANATEIMRVKNVPVKELAKAPADTAIKTTKVAEPTPESKKTAEELVKQAQEIYDRTNAAVEKFQKSVRYGQANVKNSDSAMLTAISDNVLTRATANDPAAVIKAYTKSSGTVKELAKTALDAATLQALESRSIEQTRQAAQQQQDLLDAISDLTNDATNLAGRLSTQGYTQTQLQTKVQEYVQQKVDTVTDTQLKTELQRLVKPITKTSTKTSLKVRTPVPTTTKMKTSSRKRTGGFIIKMPDSGTVIQLTSQEYAGMVAWKQGFQYVIIYPPYPPKNKAIWTRKPVEGVKYATGLGSVQASIIIQNGGSIPDITGNMGIVRYNIQQASGTDIPVITFDSRLRVPPSRYTVTRKRKPVHRNRYTDRGDNTALLIMGVR